MVVVIEIRAAGWITLISAENVVVGRQMNPGELSKSYTLLQL